LQASTRSARTLYPHTLVAAIMSGKISENRRIRERRIQEYRNYLGSAFNEDEMKRIFSIVQAAKSKGLLGTHVPESVCFVPTVNVANHLLRIANTEERIFANSEPSCEEAYAVIALLALNCIRSA
jgi:hypothetical protein